MQNLYVWAVSRRSILCCFFRGGVCSKRMRKRSVLVFLSLGEVEKGPLPSWTAAPSLRCTSLVGSLAGAASPVEDGEGERCLSGEYRRFPSRCRTSGHRVEAISGFLCSREPKGSHRCRQPTCLSSGTRWRKLSVLGQSLSLLLQQLSDIHHLSWGHWFGSAVCSRTPNSVSWLGNNNNKKIKLLNICQIHTFHKKELKKTHCFYLTLVK